MDDKYIGKMLDNRYEIIERIGVGGMAVVYKALCHRLNRYIAVKILKDDYAVDEDFRRRFHSEAQAVAMLSHPNIVTVYDVSRTQDVNYIVMELIEGMTLKQYMQKRGQLSWKESLHFASQISRALIHAHSRGIVHRDIKPHNIMILKDGSVKVADFGIARLGAAQNTLTQQTLGSVHYISPEQAKGSSIDARTDIYSLGVVMYEMLTGRLPFEGESAVAIAIQHISSVPLSPRDINPDIPEGLEAITMKAMNPNLEQRYQSAQELYDDLERFRKDPTNPVPTEVEIRTEPEKEPENLQNTAGFSRVRPISRRGELSREGYRDSSRRARAVSILSGTFLVILFILGIFLFLWRYWFDDMFSEPETMTIPSLIGMRLEEVLRNPYYTDSYNLIPTYEVSESVENGRILRQSPSADRTRVKSDTKVDIKVVVSSGSSTAFLPDLVGENYRDARIRLSNLQMNYTEEFVKSETVAADLIISTAPEAGTELKPGDTVVLVVSAGQIVQTAVMPDLIGQTAEGAKIKAGNLNLTINNIAEQESDEPAGTVVWQSIPAGTEIKLTDIINIRISSGPSEVEEKGSEEGEENPGEGNGEGEDLSVG